MKMSLFQVVLLSVFGALAVAGVLIFSLATANGQKSTIGKVTIWGTLNASAINAVLQNAVSANADLSQVSYVHKDPATYESDLANALAAGNGPDIFIIPQDQAVYDSGKVVMIPYSQLSQANFESLFVQAAQPFETPNGIIAIPFVADPLVIYWNRDIVTAAGFAKPPQYWDELPHMAAVITDCSQAYQGQSPRAGCDASRNISIGTIDFGGYQNVDHAKDILAMLILQAGGQITLRDGNGQLVSGLQSVSNGSGNPAQAALDFYTQFADPSKDFYAWSSGMPEAAQAFAAGDLAFYVGYASEESAIRQANPNLNFAVAPMPQIRSTDAKTLDYARVWAFAISRQSKNQSGAFQAASLMSAASLSAVFSQALGMSSARFDVLGNAGQGDTTVFNKMALIAHSWIDPDPQQTNGIFQQLIENTISGAAQSGSAIGQADQQLAHILGVQ